MASNAKNLQVNGTEVNMPSHISIVSGLDNYVDSKLAAFNTSTLQSQFNDLSNVYLGKNAKAASAATADSATKATCDGDGKTISATYYKKTDTVTAATKATQDGNGLNIATNYALKTGTVANASSCTTALKATQDIKGNTIDSTYIKTIALDTDGVSLKVTRGNDTTGKLSLPITQYVEASSTISGLMSAADKSKLDGIEAGAQNFIASDLTDKYSDYNDVVTAGLYRVRNDQVRWANAPKPINAYSNNLLVLQYGAWYTQILWPYYMHNLYTMYVRSVHRTDDGNVSYKWIEFTGTPVDFA